MITSVVPFAVNLPEFFYQSLSAVFYPDPIDKVLKAQKQYEDYDFFKEYRKLEMIEETMKYKDTKKHKERFKLI